MHRTMRVHGVDRRLARGGQMSLNPFNIGDCVCARTASLPNGVLSLNSGRVSWRLTVHCLHSVLPTPRHYRSCARSLGVWWERGLSALNSREEEIKKEMRLQTEVSLCWQPLWRLMTMVPASVGARNKWPSETHYTSARFGVWSDTAPDYQIHHLHRCAVTLTQTSAGEL